MPSVDPLALTGRALSVGVPSAMGYLIGDLTLGPLGAIVAAFIGGLAGVAIALIRSGSGRRTDRLKLIQIVNDEREALAERSDVIHTKQLTFLQDSLRYRGTLEVIARENAHNALSEVWRCSLQIRAYEDMLKDANIPFTPFQLRNYDELRSHHELPTPPAVD